MATSSASSSWSTTSGERRKRWKDIAVRPRIVCGGGARASTSDDQNEVICYDSIDKTKASPGILFIRDDDHSSYTIAQVLWGALFLGEPVGPDLVVGFALIIVSLALVLGLPLPRFGRRRQEPMAQGSERTMPPSTATIAPVTNDAAGDRRNAPTRPISATSP